MRRPNEGCYRDGVPVKVFQYTLNHPSGQGRRSGKPNTSAIVKAFPWF
jgi:hypothetical protein